jgi:hypothetical protein
VPIGIEDQFAFALPGDPLLGQFCVPADRLSGLPAQDLQLLAQRPHFKNAVQPQSIPPFPWRHVAQLFDGLDPRQRQQRQQQKDAGEPVESIRQRRQRCRVAQQSHR